jgi:hypothetical protein
MIIGETSFESGPGLRNWIAPEPAAGCGRSVAVGVGGRLGDGIGTMVSGWVGSRVGVNAGVAEFSTVGELIAVSVGGTLGLIVLVDTRVTVGVGTVVGVAVARPQAVRNASRVKVRKKRRCMSGLYS